jgi:hypothetical protein
MRTPGRTLPAVGAPFGTGDTAWRTLQVSRAGNGQTGAESLVGLGREIKQPLDASARITEWKGLDFLFRLRS